VEGFEYKGSWDKDPDNRVYKGLNGHPGRDWGHWTLDRNRPDWQEAMLRNWAEMGLNNTHLNIFPKNDSLELTEAFCSALEDYIRLSEKYGLKIGVRLDALDGYTAWPLHPNNPNNRLEEYLEWVKEIVRMLKGKTVYYVLGDELTLYKPEAIQIETDPSPEDLMTGRVPEDYKKWTPGQYFEYFKALSRTIKTIDPDAKVSMFAPSSGEWFNVLYLLEQGYADYGDALAINYYNYQDVPRFFEDAKRLAPHLKFLSNGVGYVSNGTVVKRYPEGDPYAKLPTETKHAEVVAKNMFAWWDLGAATAPYYLTLRNWVIRDKIYPNWYGFFGFEDFVIDEHDHLTVKRYPGWYAFQTIAHVFYNRDQCAAPSFDVSSSVPLTMLRAYTRDAENGRELLLMLWNDAGPVETRITLDSDAFRYPVRIDLFNYNLWQDEPFEASGGTMAFDLTIGPEPVILRLFDVSSRR
jgi:hypothetical protein